MVEDLKLGLRYRFIKGDEYKVEKDIKKKEICVYCHFSFKRPKGKDYGLFAVAIYSDFEGKKLITSKTKRLKLWEDQQFITAIQSYNYALHSIYEWQGMMVDAGIRQVMLVTDNSTLAGWIEEPKKNKKYAKYMADAVRMFRVGSPKEINIGIGLCEPRKAEKSYKFCREEKVEDAANEKEVSDDGSYRLRVEVGEYKSALDIVNEDKSIPQIEGIKDVQV